MVRRRRDQHDRRGRRRQEREEIRVLLEVGDRVEALTEGHCEQEGEEHLNARQRNAELVQELDELAVEVFLVPGRHPPFVPVSACDYPRAVLVYLVRHAEAAAGEPDALRALTSSGVRQARALGERLAAAKETPASVRTSPLLRARQTGEAIARAVGIASEPDDRLVPGAT